MDILSKHLDLITKHGELRQAALNVIWKLNRKEERQGVISWAKIDKNDATIQQLIQAMGD